jgi:hypothetical protein
MSGAQASTRNGSTSFARRKIDVSFLLQRTIPLGDVGSSIGEPTFVEGGNRLTLSGHRTSVTIKKAGGMAMCQMQLRIYGLTLSIMNQLSTLGRVPMAQRRTYVSVSAGDDTNGMGVVFQGSVQAAWADFKGSPEVAFYVVAASGMDAELAVAPPSSYRGSASVAVIMSSLAAQMGIAFENNGVDTVLANPYFPGTLRAQVRACAAAAGIEQVIDNDTLIIWPSGGHRGGSVPLISADTGMVGYPAFTSNGISFVTVFNPSINFGALVEVKSLLPQANGRWRVFNLVHDLEAETPGGAWFTSLEGAFPAQAVVRSGPPSSGGA